MANPLKILTVLTASQAAKFEQGLDVNSQKLTNVAAGTVNSDGVNYGQLTNVSGAIKSYVDAADQLLQSNLDAASGALKTFIDGVDAAQTSANNTLSGAMKTYVDAQDTALSGAYNVRVSALSGAVFTAITAEATARIAADAALSSSMKSYVDAQNAAQDAASSAFSGAIKSYVDAADAQLQSNLDSVSGAIKSYVDAGDALLQSNLDAVSGALKSYVDAEVLAEETRALAAEAALSSALAQEITDRGTAVSGLSSSMAAYVDAETARALAAEGVLSGNLATEVANRIAADTALSGAYNTRINFLSGAVATAITAEATARAAADAALSSSLKSYVDAQDTALSGAFDTRITTLSGAVKTYVDAQDNALSSSMASYVDTQDAAEAAARVAEDLTFLKLDGSRAMTGDLNMGGKNIVSAKSGSFSGDVTVAGNLQVNGALTYINTSNLEVTDKLVTIAKGAANGAAADGAGIEVDGAGVSFVYDNAAGKWVSDIGLDVAGEAVFQGAMKLSGSAFSNITTPVVGGKFDVSDAIHALDVKVGTNADALSNAYDALRLVVTGTLSSGQVIVNLTTVGGAQFAVAEIANIALDVMVDADNTGYTNDLVAIKMYVDGASLKVQIDAPATPSAAFRLIAVNEKDGGLAV